AAGAAAARRRARRDARARGAPRRALRPRERRPSDAQVVHVVPRRLPRLGGDEPYPDPAPHPARTGEGRRQRVHLPPGYLAARDDETPPAAEPDAAALSGG